MAHETKPPIISVAHLKAALGVTGTDEDELLAHLEERAADWVEEQLGQRRFREPLATVEYVEGKGTTRLILRGHIADPDEVVTVTERFSSGGEAKAFTAFSRRGDVLVRTDGAAWHAGAEYAVSYLDGYESAPGDVQELVAELVGGMLEKARGSAEGLSSEKIGDYSYTVSSEALSAIGSLSTNGERTRNRWRRIEI